MRRCTATLLALLAVLAPVLTSVGAQTASDGGGLFSFLLPRAASVPRDERGLSPESLERFRSQNHTLLCLESEGAGERRLVSAERVNDDFCDCTQDGADESGTSACSNGGYHCRNEGFFARRVPSSQVGDGVCDCCDGSDEWQLQHHSALRCANRCEQVAQEYQRELTAFVALQTSGAREKKGYVEQARAFFKDAKKNAAKLQRRLDESYAKKYSPQVLQERSSLRAQLDLHALPRTIFGKEQVFMPLALQCATIDLNEKQFKGGSFVEGWPINFRFTVCPFRHVLQQNLDDANSSPVVLGRWGNWKDAKKKTIMIYEGGDPCWQGPPRRVEVYLVCGSGAERLLDVLENGKCRYFMVLTSPAACDERLATNAAAKPFERDWLSEYAPRNIFGHRLRA